MYNSHTLQDEQFSMFATFIKNVIHGNTKYKALVDPVLNEAHDLAMGNKNLYTIDRSSFPITTYLYEKNPAYFQAFDVRTIQPKQYEEVLKMIETHFDLIYA